MLDLSVLQRLPEWIHVRDPELKVVWATDLACQTFGWDIDQGQVSAPVSPGDEAAVSEAGDTAGTRGHWVGHLSRKDAKGHVRYLHSRWSAITDEAGVLEGYFILERDRIERPPEDEQLIRAQRMESIGTLAGGVAHDINNVLGPILLGAEMIRRRVDDPWILKKIEGIERSARRGADVVKQVLDFSRGVEGEKIPVQIRHVIKDLVGFAQHTFSKQITVEGSFPRDLPLVLGDASQIRQAVLNLMVNARDAITSSGTVRIDMSGISLDTQEAAALSTHAHPGDFVVISVSDTGRGIGSDIRDRIFEPFFSTHPRSQGSGLGLSSALTIVNSHGGFMTVSSEVGVGSCFSMYLPQAQAPSKDAPLDATLSSRPAARHTILIVDDEPMMLEMNTDMLTSFGHQTLSAEHGRAGLDRFLEDPMAVDLVIADINMPFMDGPTMIREMRAVRPDLPVIMVSGLSEVDHARDGTGLEGTETHGSGILHKPYSIDQLLSAIADAMRASETSDGEAGSGHDTADGTSRDAGDTLSDSDFDALMGGDW